MTVEDGPVRMTDRKWINRNLLHAHDNREDDAETHAAPSHGTDLRAGMGKGRMMPRTEPVRQSAVSALIVDCPSAGFRVPAFRFLTSFY